MFTITAYFLGCFRCYHGLDAATETKCCPHANVCFTAEGHPSFPPGTIARSCGDCSDMSEYACEAVHKQVAQQGGRWCFDDPDGEGTRYCFCDEPLCNGGGGQAHAANAVAGNGSGGGRGSHRDEAYELALEMAEGVADIGGGGGEHGPSLSFLVFTFAIVVSYFSSEL